jgi:hypothetical protein
MRVALAAACAAAALAAAEPPSALGLGANLNRTANATLGCQFFPSVAFDGSRLYQGPYAVNSCTWLSTGNIRGQEQAGAPAPGVLTRVRVRAGPVVGPVRATILEAIAAPSFACCFGRIQNQVFTPRPNAVTTVNVRLPMRNDTDFDRQVQTVDYLGLSVLGTNFPIPAHDGGFPDDPSLLRPGSPGFGPAVLPGQERADGGGAGDFIPLVCNSAFGCRGVLKLLGLGARGASASGVRLYGKRPFKVQAGARARLRSRLNGQGRRAVRHGGAVVLAKLRFSGAGTPKTEKRRLRLHR